MATFGSECSIDFLFGSLDKNPTVDPVIIIDGYQNLCTILVPWILITFSKIFVYSLYNQSVELWYRVKAKAKAARDHQNYQLITTIFY